MDLLPLTTDRLILRKFTRRDLPTFVNYRSQLEVARYQSWLSYSTADAENFFEQQHGLTFNLDETWFQIAVERKADAVLVGDVAVHFFDGGRQAEIGMTFDLAYQRQGYAQEAVASVVALLFALGKHRLSATTDARNERAARLLEKTGFRREAHYRENIFFKGAWSDEYGYALLRSEWSMRTQSLSVSRTGLAS